MNDKEQNYIIETLLKSYPNSSLINEEYITNLLEKLEEKDSSQTIFTCKNIINNYLANQAKVDENILFELTIDMASVKERICHKLKLDINNPIYDDYLMEGILSYDGSKSLDLYLSSFLMQKIKIKYVPLKSSKILEYKDHKTNKDKELISGSEPEKIVEVPPVITLEEKSPIREEDLKVESSSLEQEVIFSKEDKVEEEAKEEIASTIQLTLKDSSLSLTKRRLKNQRRREAKKEQSQALNEEISFEVPIEELEDLLVLDSDETEIIEDVTKDLCEPLEQHEEINGKELADRISEVIKNIPPLEEDNIVTKLYKLLGVKINIEDNIFYYYYTCLRFGTKEKTYSLEIIAATLGLTLEEVIAFEEYTINQVKELLNTVDKNISLTFN